VYQKSLLLSEREKGSDALLNIEVSIKFFQSFKISIGFLKAPFPPKAT